MERIFLLSGRLYLCLPTELEDLANKYAEFQKIGCEIYSVSCDSHFVHKAWHDASKTIKKIEYPMLADPTGKLARDFDVMIEEDGMAERGSFIVNPEGKIVAYEVIAGNVGAMPMNCSAACRQASLLPSTATRFARQNGSPARKP